MNLLTDFFQYQFLQYAFVATVFVAILTGLFSSIVVLKRMEFIGEGVAHAVFGGIAAGLFFGLSDMITALATAIVFAFFIALFSSRRLLTENNLIGIFMPVFMSLGVILLSFIDEFVPDILGLLFGNILLISLVDIYILVIVTFLAGLLFLFYRKEILYYCYDEQVARLLNVRVKIIHFLLLVGLAVTIVSAIKIAGTILVTAFLVFPAVVARFYARNFSLMLILSVACNLIAGLSGLLLSTYFDLPPGPVMVLFLFVLFLISYFHSHFLYQAS